MLQPFCFFRFNRPGIRSVYNMICLPRKRGRQVVHRAGLGLSRDETEDEIEDVEECDDAIEVCPICGSAEVYYEMGGYTGKKYHCKDCNYIGALIVRANQEMREAIRMGYEERSDECDRDVAGEG